MLPGRTLWVQLNLQYLPAMVLNLDSGYVLAPISHPIWIISRRLKSHTVPVLVPGDSTSGSDLGSLKTHLADIWGQKREAALTRGSEVHAPWRD